MVFQQDLELIHRLVLDRNRLLITSKNSHWLEAAEVEISQNWFKSTWNRFETAGKQLIIRNM